MPLAHRRQLTIFALLSAALLLLQCTSSGSPTPPEPDMEDQETALELRNIILVIGDGMGPNQVGFLQQYARHAASSPYGDNSTAIENMASEGVTGLAETYAQGALTVDSACSATHLSTGQMAPLEALGVDMEGNPVPTILQRARDTGRATGLVTDTRATHATPAAFFSHIAHRSQEDEIAEQLFDEEVDLMLAGGLRHFIPNADHLDERPESVPSWAWPPSSHRQDSQDLLHRAAENGYSLAFDQHQLRDANNLPLLGLFAKSGMFNAIEELQTTDDPDRRQPTLDEMTTIALELLDQRSEGFFLMVEAGQIDWAGHDNDASWLLHEMLRLDITLGAILHWLDGRDDTLLIVTADHETGGFGFSYSGHDLPEPTPLPGTVFDHRYHQPNYNFGTYDQLDDFASQQKTFGDILRTLNMSESPSAEKLQDLIQAHTPYTLSPVQAGRVLQRHNNPMHDPNHPYLRNPTIPKIDDFTEFYPYGDSTQANLLGRALAAQQNVVWSTGTHTHTPVPVIALGPERHLEAFQGWMHLADIGQTMNTLFHAP